MPDRGKTGGEPHPRRTERSSRAVARRLTSAVLALFLTAAVAVGVTVLLVRSADSPTAAKTAAIVDQLSLSQPNPDFIAAARTLLTQASYLVDYFPGEQVTVEFYRTLPTRGYDLILLRVHAGITTGVEASTGDRTETEYMSLFTGEPYAPGKYAEELNRLGRAVYYEGADPLFGIGPRFIEESMEGRFDGTLIIMMGCDGLRSRRTAEAFLNRGAEAFVSWSRPVTAAHTDAATERLLDRLLQVNVSTAEAVRQTAEEVGPDPIYGGELRVLAAE